MIDARNYALKLIQIRDRTEKELRSKMSEKGFDDEATEKEIAFLKEYGYIDDLRFAQRYIKDGINLKKWGKGRIRAELIRKGVEKELVISAVEEAFLEADEDRLFSLMESRFKDADLSSMKERNRIFNYYMRRGFSPDEIKGAINRLCSFRDIITEEY